MSWFYLRHSKIQMKTFFARFTYEIETNIHFSYKGTETNINVLSFGKAKYNFVVIFTKKTESYKINQGLIIGFLLKKIFCGVSFLSEKYETNAILPTFSLSIFLFWKSTREYILRTLAVHDLGLRASKPFLMAQGFPGFITCQRLRGRHNITANGFFHLLYI